MDLDALGGLVKLGLSEKEANTYLALLRLGEAGASHISKESGIHPRSTYDSLEGLVSKGLVTFAEKKGSRVFAAFGLETLMGLVEERRHVVENLIPTLEKQLKTHDEPLVRVFRGIDGMRSVWEDLLKEAKPIYFYGGAMQGFRFHLKDYAQRWNQRREKLKIPVRLIYIDQPGVKNTFKGFKYWNAKPLPEKLYSSVVWWLYGQDKMVLVFWGESPVAILVKSLELAKSYRNFFEIVWRAAGKTGKKQKIV